MLGSRCGALSDGRADPDLITDPDLIDFLPDATGNARADADGDGQITLEEIAGHVGPRVTRAARQDNRDQTPTLTTGGDPGGTMAVYGVKAR